jgi:NAD(P)-dependent dehydrogenase (short-subunit alcohol dehydrogenase family)
MRQKIIAGNWKMNLDLDQGKELLIKIIDSDLNSNCVTIVAPPYIHLNSFYRLSNALQPTLIKSSIQGGASIIGIASMTSFFGLPIVPGYGAGKGGLVQLIKTLSMKWANEKIRVNWRSRLHSSSTP